MRVNHARALLNAATDTDFVGAVSLKKIKKNNMCLYPRFIKNAKYLPNKKNGHKPPKPTDGRTEWVAIGCGNCIECRQQKANSWRIRLHEELKVHKHAYFVTNTFSNESLKSLMTESGLTECNGICAIAVRRFLERYRKKYGHSLKHWYITELGHENTERIHLHGIIFSEKEITPEEYSQIWSYGRTDLGQYCNARSINYIVKYVTKIDTQHKTYHAQIFASPGLGKAYLNENNLYKHRYKPRETREYYLLSNGLKVNLPIYYRNWLFSEAQRENLWLEKLDQHRIFVRGIECKNIDKEKGYNTYIRTLQSQQEENNALGYGDLSKEWQKEEYNVTTKMLNPAKKSDFAK